MQASSAAPVATEYIRGARNATLTSIGNIDHHPSLHSTNTSSAQHSNRLVSSLQRSFIHAFLPEGYPHSVTGDYLSFQTYDTIQALSSYVRGMLTTQALLAGVGVGSQTATAYSAALQFFTRDLIGMLGGVVFAATQGSSFDSLAKQWRLAADAANDIGLTLELAAPLFPSLFLVLACLGALCRTITGVAGGATRFALTQHFAVQRNAADVAAKESSQETATTLLGMAAGMYLTKLAVVNATASWVAFWLLTILHMWANIKAMRCLRLTSLNKPRLDLILEKLIDTGGRVQLHSRITTPEVAAAEESLWPPPVATVLTWCGLLKRRRLNIVVAPELSSLSVNERQAVAAALNNNSSNAISAKYKLVPISTSKTIVLLKRTSNVIDMLQGYCAAGVLQLEAYSGNAEKHPALSKYNVPVLVDNLKLAGWKLDSAALLQGQSRLEWGT